MNFPAEPKIANWNCCNIWYPLCTSWSRPSTLLHSSKVRPIAEPLSTGKPLAYPSTVSICRLTITASCPMDLQYFPMDRQLCFIEIESCEYSPHWEAQMTVTMTVTPSIQLGTRWPTSATSGTTASILFRYLPTCLCRSSRCSGTGKRPLKRVCRQVRQRSRFCFQLIVLCRIRVLWIREREFFLLSLSFFFIVVQRSRFFMRTQILWNTLCVLAW